jgi:hypothetical protein
MKQLPLNNATEKTRLSAMADFCANFFTEKSVNAQTIIGSQLNSPPIVMDKTYLYINPERYHAMRVDSWYFEQAEDSSFNFYISADYHASYSFDIYGKSYDSFDYAKQIKSLLFGSNFFGVNMSFMNCDEINNLSSTILSDSLIFQRFKFVAHFLQNDIINVGSIPFINQIEVVGLLDKVNLDIIVPKGLLDDVKPI